MATKYDRVDPCVEKLKRLYNCPRLTRSDQEYLNFQFERYKQRAFHIGALCGFSMFMAGSLPFMKQTSSFKYWSAILTGTFIMYRHLTHLNRQHYEQISQPYFEKYKVK
jgi:hypothetical protein